MSTPEGEVLNACLEYLRLRRVYAWRNNSGAVKLRGAAGARDRFVRYGKPGSSDILGILDDGRFLAIECKAPRGKGPTEAQRDFLEDIRKRGGLAFVARSVEDMERELDLADAKRSADQRRGA
ncbi:MAG: VRR-NUC domain-containing protein [Spirochaetaceae bacterium]|nr:VRR-NUC domain-containing protein [Spirochaetaceae bacterium]